MLGGIEFSPAAGHGHNVPTLQAHRQTFTGPKTDGIPKPARRGVRRDPPIRAAGPIA